MHVFGRIGVALALTATLGLAAVPGAHAGVININAGFGTVGAQVGDHFTLLLGISGLSGASYDSLSAFDLRVSYDQLAASFVGASFVDPASGINQLDLPDQNSFGFLGEAIDDGAGTISAFGLSGNTPDVLDMDQADSFVFLSLQFEALSPSSGAQFALLTSDPFILFGDSYFGELPVTYGNTAVQVAITHGGVVGNVPEPESIVLLLAGLVALGLGRQRLRRATALSLLGAGLALGGAAQADSAKVTTAAVVKPASGNTLNATVVEVKGQRMKIRSSTGVEQWVTTVEPLNDDMVGKRVRGTVRRMGDTQTLESPMFD